MAVTFDAVGPSSAGTGVTGNPPPAFSWSHTCTGSNRLLVVGVSLGAGGAYGGSDAGITLTATYNGTSMTSAGLRHSNDITAGFGQLFYLVAPSTGSNTIAIGVSGLAGSTVDIIGGSLSFTGVDQSTPVQSYTSAVGNSGTAVLSVSTASSNMAVSLAVTGTAVNTDSQTSQWLRNFDANTGASNAAQSTANASSSASFSYGVTSDIWAVLGLDVVASSAGLTPLPWLRF